MRKLFPLFLALLATTSLWAYDFQSGDLYYNITSDSTVAVTYQEYNSSSNYASIYTVTVPETITYDGTTYSVTSIGKYAFYDCSSLVSVTIPNSVTHIGDHAFYKTSSLTSVNIPNSVTSIGDDAFRGCSSLTAIDIPNSLTKIVHGMFDDCSSLATVTIPNSVMSIGQLAFDGCSSLTSITIPNSVISIGWNAFSGCRALTAITIPESVTNVDGNAFADCSSLTSVVWNAINCGKLYNSHNRGYTYFEGDGFEFPDSTSYSYEEVGEFVKQFPWNEWDIINDSPFNGCDGIKSFSFGENVEFIPDGLCYGLDGITSITIPESVSSIGERSFAECSSLDTIYCNSKDIPIIYLTYLDVELANIGMIYSYDDVDAPYIYDNTILCVPCQLLDIYKSQEEYTIRFKNIQCSKDTTPPEPEIPTEGIGVFSVGEGKTVTFSRGNLQYTQSTDTWSFAENQWDMIGTDNMTGGSVESNQYGGYYKYGDALADKIDLFGWSTSAANFGVEILEDYDYSDSFVDWGTNTIGNDTPNTWRTLSYNEWSYLRNTRVNADALCGVAQVNGVSGLVFLPDNWACPDGVTFKSGFHSDDSKEAYGQYQTFTADQWSKLESAGAVFLPAAGHRNGSVVAGVQNCGYYWSAREKGINYVYSLGFRSDEASMGYLNHLYGRSVRLVKDVNTTIFLPTLVAIICEGDIFTWDVNGQSYYQAGTYTYEEIVEDENYIYHYIHTLELTVIPFSSDTIVVEAYDSYEWHGEVYTESGTYTYYENCSEEVLHLTIIDTPTPPSELQDTIYYADAICEGEIYIWLGMEFTETGTYTCIYEEIVEDEDYTYIYRQLHILYLTVLPYETIEYEVEAYDSYVWHGIVYTESGTYIYEEHCYQEILQLTIIDTPTPPEPEIPTEGIGVFSIGEGKTVTFSRGNLQYTQSTQTWSFAANQYDYIGTDNVTGGSVSSDPKYGDSKEGTALADKVDLFGWSTSSTNFGVSTSDSNSDYSGSFVDWGTNKIGGGAPNTWRTLTSAEWKYLLNTRPNASSLKGVAQVNGMNGLVLLPDNWTCPEGVTFKSGFHSGFGEDYYAEYQTFTADQWSKLEAAGAVFLPASGYRSGSYVKYVQDFGSYWSASEYYSYNANYLRFYSNATSMGLYDRDCGLSVRLVKDVNTTIFLPTLVAIICEGDIFTWDVNGQSYYQAGTYTYEEIVEDENYIYHYIHTLELQVRPSSIDTIVVEAYDSYEWHGKVYTESGTYFYEEWCFQEILELTIIPSEEKEYLYIYLNELICDGYDYRDPITGEYYLISSWFHNTWSDTITGTEVDTIYTFNITPIVAPEPLTEDILYAIGAVPELVAGEMVNTMGTTEPIMWYYQMNDKDDIADVIDVEWVAGHDVVLNTEQTTHTMVLEVRDECDDIIPMEFTFPVSKKDSEPQDTTIYIYHTEDVTICEGETLIWMGMEYTETGTYAYEKIVEIVEEDDYIYHYHHIYTLKLTVITPMILVWPIEAYDSYEWHGVVYTESGTYLYEEWCFQEILELTIIPSEDNQGEVVVEPSTNSVTITWQKEDDADTYIIVIKQGDKVICTLIFDAEGNLVSVNYLPGRESNKHGIQHAGLTSDSFQYTITGLTPSTDYTYTVTATDDSDNTISSYSGEFTTHHATSVENTNSQSPTIDCQKILYEDHIYILRDGKTYNVMGQEM